jgi:hypothetical protein
VPKVGVVNSSVDHLEVAFVIADLGARDGELYAPADEVLLSGPLADRDATDLGGEEDHAPGDRSVADRFERSRARFEEIVEWLGEEATGGLEHFELESRLEAQGRALLRVLFQDRLDLGAEREQRVDVVADAAGVMRGAVEPGHRRPLDSVFGTVAVGRLAYRGRGEQNLYVADGLLNLPVEERASHGVRRLVAVESSRGSFEQATGQVRERTGLRIGKRQAEQLAVRAAVDFEEFYATRACLPVKEDNNDVLVLSADGKGIVMRAEALRAATAQAAQRASPKLKTRLSRGEKRNRKADR